MPALFAAVGSVMTGPQLMAITLMESDGGDRDIERLGRYRQEGLHVANMLAARCHEERRSSVYLNIDRDDDSAGLPLDEALSQRGAPRTIVVFRNQPALPGSTVNVWVPPGLDLPGAPSTWR